MSEELQQQVYASLFENVVDANKIQVIRNTVQFSMPTGDGRFQHQIEQTLNRKVGYVYRGRPRRSTKVDGK